MPLEHGTLLNNRYTIISTIASGGMGAIYRATDEILGISVAVKENFFSTEEFLRQFRREATILAGLRHPNLPRVTDHFVITGQGQYLVMDFIEGHDLRDIISRQGALSEENVVRIGVAICDALEYMHSRDPGIVHRDIKPGNIKITPTGHVTLVDFGLAKFSRGEATTIGAQALTPGYAPPEQYGQGTEPRSDLYALGATLYALLTGNVPEDGLSRILGSIELTPIRKHNPRASTAVAKVIERAMAVQLTDRYQNASALKQALLNAAPQIDPGQPVHLDTTPSSAANLTVQTSSPQAIFAPPSGPTPRAATGQEYKGYQPPSQQPQPQYPSQSQKQNPLQYQQQYPSQALQQPAPQYQQPSPQSQQQVFPPKKRQILIPVVIAGLGGFFILAVLAALFLLLPRLQQTKNTQVVPTSVTVENSAIPTEPTPSNPPPTSTMAPLPTATLLEVMVIAPSETPLSIPSATETSVPTPTSAPVLAATPIGGGPGEIAFSSDRGGLVQIWITSVNEPNARQVTNLADGACQPDWSPDGKRLVFISPCSGQKENYTGSSLYLINYDGTGLIPLSSLPGGDFDPAWSPDGNQIAFTSLRDNSIPHIYLYNLADNSTTRLSRVVNYERQPAWSPDGKLLAYQTTRLGEPQIWTMSSTGENAKEFSSLPGSYEWMPVWAPDGSVLVYSQGNPSRLVSRQFNDKQAKEFPISETVSPAEAADYSPDGWWLVFESKQANNLDIYLMGKNGGNLTRLTDSAGLDFQPSWSPIR